MKKSILLISVLSMALMVNAAIPTLTKSAPLTLTAASEGFSQSDNAKALEDGKWINWSSSTIHEGFAKWRVNIATPGIYAVTLDMKSTNTYEFRVCVLNTTNDNVLAQVLTEHQDRHEYSNVALPCLENMNIVALESGEYDIIVSNIVQWSTGMVRGLTLSYLNGAVIDVPAYLDPLDAILSELAFINEDNELRFTRDDNTGYILTQYGMWNIYTDGGFYSFTLNANSTNSHHYNLSILNSDESIVHEFTLDGSSSTPLTATTVPINLATGRYIIKIQNTTQYSTGRVINITANYLGGATIAMPDTLKPADAILSSRAFVNTSGEVDSLQFTPDNQTGYIHDEWAKWNINVAKAGKYKFAANVKSSNGQNYRITLKNEDESSTINTTYGPNNSSGAKTISTDLIDLTAGNYVLIIEDTVKWSKGRVINIVGTYEGGTVVNVPGQLLGEDAVLNAAKLTRAANGDITYGDNADPTNEYVYWNIHSEAGEFIVTLNLDEGNGSGHNYLVELYDGSTLKSSTQQGDDNWDKGNIELTDHIVVPTEGDYTIRLTNQTAHSSNIIKGLTFTKVIAPTVVTLNDTDEENSAWVDNVGGVAVNVELSRTFTGGMYNTICLPFAVSSTKVTAAFGPGVELMYMSGATLNGNVLDLEFTPTNSIYQGTPYLIKPAADVVDPLFKDVEFKLSKASATAGTNADFIGTFVRTTIAANENNLYLQANNLLMFSDNDVSIKGTRAYFRVRVPNAALSAVRPRIVMQGQVLTEIDQVSSESMRGTKVIENGVLYLMYNGKKFNVQGQIVK